MTYFSKDFGEQIKTCLIHLYDQHALLDQPLLQKLVPDGDSLQRTQEFRKQIMSIVESLNPERDATIGSKPYRRYLILQQRYIEEQQHTEIIPQLALSERQYYREHREAVDTLTQILWERLHNANDFSVQTEAQRIYHDSRADEIDIEAVFQGIAEAMQPLVQLRGMQIRMPEVFPPGGLRTNRDILRQLIIWLVSRLVDGEFDTLNITCERDTTRYKIIFSPAPVNYEPTSTINTFLNLLNAYLEQQSDTLVMSLPIRNQVLLLIDDNPDAPNLFRRLLVNVPYQLVVASNAERGITMAQEMQPMAVLLDVMMPNRDGWEVLHNLKNHPQTAHIPVIICSVLEVGELALSLGADGYLLKPPGKDELMAMLDDWESVVP